MRLRHLAVAAAALAAAVTLTAAASAAASDQRGRDDREHEEDASHHRGDGDHRDGEHHDGAEHDGGRGRRGGGDDDHRGRGEGDHHRLSASRDDADPVYVKECGACHLAYPPALLPAASWRALLGGLDRHFGQDAGLDEPQRARLEGWLVERAGPARAGAGGAPERITGLAWFRDEHREVPRGAAARPAVRSMANCAACHQDAARWDFDEHRVRIPR